MTYTKNKIISKPNYRVDFFEKRNRNIEKELRTVFEDIKDIDEIVNDNSINKILIIENDFEKYNIIKEKFETSPQFEIATSQKGFIDINPAGASKGNALEILANHFDVKLHEIVVFGDQDNDVSMMKKAGISVAMANASKNAKQESNYITESNDNNGVALWIQNNILK
jgi:Cof subfamily protein (haloacid dehalogenase superfamily)